MKVLHDIKNPIMAIQNTINDMNLDRETMCKIANTDIEDLNDILDNLKAEFKSRHKMNFKEEKRAVKIMDFVENLSRSNLKLAQNGNNTFNINVKPNVPKLVVIPRFTVLRICNNLISNAFKHTQQGNVEVNLMLADQNIQKEN